MADRNAAWNNRATQLTRVALLLVLCAGLPHKVLAGSRAPATMASVGDSIVSLIEQVRSDGTNVVYSTAVVPDTLLVERQRDGKDSVELLRIVLNDVGLDLKSVDGLMIVAREKSTPKAESGQAVPATRSLPEPAIPEITTTASKYEILRESISQRTDLMQRDIEVVPNFGSDPIRAMHRLPGVASGGTSAKPHIRGSEANDMAVILNGQRLLDPFHVRDYQSLFSAIDTRAIDRLEVYTGGFPARYGDRMGGIVVIDAVQPEDSLHSEAGVSVFNTSLLSSGRVAEGDIEWLFSARRGNLDRIIDRKYGRPSYYDVFSEIGVAFSPRTHLSVNGLMANDDVLIVTEDSGNEFEYSHSDVRNSQFWATWTQEWGHELTSQTTFSTATFVSVRNAQIEDPEAVTGFVVDQRRLGIYGAHQTWQWPVSDYHRLTFGWEAYRQDAEYDYRSGVEYLAPQVIDDASTEGSQDTVLQNIDGNSYGVFVSDSWRLSNRTVAEVGFRWDQQTYTSQGTETQFSPRLGLVHEVNDDLTLRASLGRYYQSQGIHELQVEDGLDRFFPAQRADHAILGLNYRLSDDLSVRVETYYKWYDRIRPRFENMLDPLAVIPELEPDRVIIAPDAARALGIEFSLAYEGPRGLNWWASYTNSRADDYFGDRITPRSWDQRHAVQLGLTWSNETWDVGVAANAHSGWPTTDVYTEPGPSPDTPIVLVGDRNGARLGSFGSLDFRIGYKRPLGDGMFHMFFELSNATNRRNLCCADFDMEFDSNGQLFLEKEYDYWLPRLPALGFLVEF